jgi:hypothetical protein
MELKRVRQNRPIRAQRAVLVGGDSTASATNEAVDKTTLAVVRGVRIKLPESIA